jgi:hypothetical protein
VRKAADHITASEPPAGVEEASCYVFGREDVQIVLEVAGNDQDAVLSRVLELTDIEHVARVRTIHTTRTMTNGFGGELRAAMAGAVQT